MRRSVIVCGGIAAVAAAAALAVALSAASSDDARFEPALATATLFPDAAPAPARESGDALERRRAAAKERLAELGAIDRFADLEAIDDDPALLEAFLLAHPRHELAPYAGRLLDFRLRAEGLEEMERDCVLERAGARRAESPPFSAVSPDCDAGELRAAAAAEGYWTHALAAETESAAGRGIAAAAPPLESGTRPDAEAVLSGQLAKAELAYNRPTVMRYGDGAPVELALAPAAAGIAAAAALSEDLEGEIRTAPRVDYAIRMRATLSGPDFHVEPAGPQTRTVLSDRPAVWSWTVMPTGHGPDRVLTLSVEAVLSRDGAELPPLHVETFADRIRVEVGLWDRAVIAAREVETVHAAFAATGASLVAIALWLLKRVRGDGGEKGPRRIELIVRRGR